MKLTEKDIEQLEAYWLNNLSDDERLNLEKRMASDTVFRQEARQFQLLNEGLEVVKQRQMRHRFQDLDATLPDIKTPPQYNWLMIGLVALGLALAALAVWYLAIREEKPKVKPIYAAYFEPYPALGITMGDTPDVRKKEAMVLYAQKQYAKALPLLNDSFNETKDSMLLFYIGVSHLALGQADEARVIFEKLQSADSVPKEAAQWYLALSYVGSKQNDKATLLLKNMTSDKYKDSAQKLLIEMDKKE